MATTITVDFNELPYTKDYSLLQGDTIEELYHVELNTAGTYADDNLSACTITLTVEKSDGTAVITARAITASGTYSNEIKLLITATDTAAWDGAYNYEIKCVWPNADNTFTSGATRVLVSGVITAQDVI